MSRTTRALATTLVALALGGATGAPGAGAAEIPDHPIRGSISGERIGPFEQLKDACGVAVDAQGDVYVADYYQNRIVVFNQKWEYLTQINAVDPRDAGGASPLDGPCDLAVDSAGRLYVNDYHQDVVRFTPAQYPPQAGTSYGARETIDQNHSTGVTVDPATDDIYVDDRTYVARYEAPVAAGEVPSAKIGEGSLEDADSVAISRFESSDPLIYAADAATETIKVYDPALDPNNPQEEIRGEGTERGGFYLTDTDLAVDSADGHLYVSQNLEPHFEFTPEAVVYEFSPAGLYRGPVPRSFANGFASFLQSGEPTGLATYKGDLYVTSGNYENAAVFSFGPPAPFDPQLLAVEKAGAGEGTVTSTPAAIGCGGVCEAEINKDASVVLEATPGPGSVIAGWSGCDEVPAANRCVVRMSAGRKVTVEFGAAPAPSAVARGPLGASASAVAAPGAAPGQTGPAHPRARRGGGAHSSEVAQKGPLRVSLSGELAPKTLPRSGDAPVAVSLGGKISTTDGSQLPRLKKLEVEINRGGRLDDRGLPVCPLAQILTATTAQARSACSGALVGSGHFEANIVLRGQAPYPTKGRLLIFNGCKGGKPVLLGHIYSSQPFATSFVITFKIANRSHGTYGTVLSASLPEALGNWGYVTGIAMKLSRRYSFKGNRHSFLSASCSAPKGFGSAPFPLIRASFGFDDGRELASTLNRDCKVR